MDGILKRRAPDVNVMKTDNLLDGWILFDTEKPDVVFIHLTTGRPATSDESIYASAWPALAARADEAPKNGSRMVLYMRKNKPDVYIIGRSGAWELSATDEQAISNCDRFHTETAIDPRTLADEIMEGLSRGKQTA